MYELKLVCKHCFNESLGKNHNKEYICLKCGSVYNDSKELFTMEYKLEDKQPRIYERWLKE